MGSPASLDRWGLSGATVLLLRLARPTAIPYARHLAVAPDSIPQSTFIINQKLFIPDPSCRELISVCFTMSLLLNNFAGVSEFHGRKLKLAGPDRPMRFKFQLNFHSGPTDSIVSQILSNIFALKSHPLIV